MLEHQGRYSEAEPLTREALQLYREALGPRHPTTLVTLNNLAVVVQHQGRYGEAESLYRETLELHRVAFGPHHPETLVTMNNLAAMLGHEGRYGEAEPLHRETLRLRREILGPHHPDTLSSMNNLALVLEHQGRYDEVEPLHRETLRLYREVLGPRHPGTAASMNNLAEELDRQGRYGEAEALFEETLQLRREVVGTRHPDTLSGMNNLALVRWHQGRYRDAEPILREALDLSRDADVLGPAHPMTLLIQLNIVGDLAVQGRVSEAVTLQRQMEAQVLTWLGAELYSTEAAPVRRKLVASQSTYQDIALSLALLPGAGADAGELAASALLRFKGLAVEEEAYLARLVRLGQDERIRTVATEVRQLHQELAKLFQGGGSGQEVKDLAGQLDAKELALGRISRDYASSLQVRNASLQDLRARLGPQSALLELRAYHPMDCKTWELGAWHWAGVLISADGEIEVHDLGAATDTRVHAILNNDPSAETAAGVLYRKLLAPFGARLAKLQRLYVAPDALLYLLPFGMLRDASGHRVLDGLDLRLVQTGRDLLRPPADLPAKGLVAVGGIDFDAAQIQPPDDAVSAALTQTVEPLSRLRTATADALRDDFTALEASGEEVRAISALYRVLRRDEPVVIVEGARPTKPWLLALPPPRVLHLATHGFYRVPKEPADRPMLLAGVALAGANRSLRQGGEDGILYALEAEDLNLEGTELVVLSACKTALGQIDYGEGVSGLVRALRTAGARNVLVTLRPVDDQGAKHFMQRFYFYWLRQLSSDPAAALRDAQQEAANDSDTTWTSFVLVGD